MIVDFAQTCYWNAISPITRVSLGNNTEKEQCTSTHFLCLLISEEFLYSTQIKRFKTLSELFYNSEGHLISLILLLAGRYINFAKRISRFKWKIVFFIRRGRRKKLTAVLYKLQSQTLDKVLNIVYILLGITLVHWIYSSPITNKISFDKNGCEWRWC